uniref:Minor capsid protein P8 central region domain-containing protein n=1 Tax=viral metagenome TaxID=1070528 RepID=A0A6C0CQC1_9ZZZZ
MNTQCSNGRVNIIQPDTSVVFQMQDRIPVGENDFDYRGDAVKGNWYRTQLSDAFFSAENVQILQNGIRAGVYKMSQGQYIIGTQSEDELRIVMRSIFLQYSQNLPTNIKEQIAKLNNLVLDYSVRQVYGSAQGYMKYKYDVSHMYEPIARPVMSKTNDKQLQLKKWF